MSTEYVFINIHEVPNEGVGKIHANNRCSGNGMSITTLLTGILYSQMLANPFRSCDYDSQTFAPLIQGITHKV